MTTPESSIRVEPLARKPTTLPHGILDEGALAMDGGGESTAFDPSIGNVKSTNTPTPSMTQLFRSISQTSQTHEATCNWSLPPAVRISIRIVFYLMILAITIGLTLAACKFANIWDPCEHLYITSTECKVTSYMKGMVYHKECTEERSCILPGFESNMKRQGWSLYKPNDNAGVEATSPLEISEAEAEIVPEETATS